MAIPHAAPGIPVDLRRPDEPLSQAQTSALVKTNAFEAIRMVIPKGHEVCRNHRVDGPITVQCLEGQIAFTADSERAIGCSYPAELRTRSKGSTIRSSC